jgi:hypothetical protein
VVTFSAGAKQRSSADIDAARIDHAATWTSKAQLRRCPFHADDILDALNTKNNARPATWVRQERDKHRARDGLQPM